MFLKYNLGSLWSRRAATLLTVISIGATVSVVASILSLNRGFNRLFESGGREDVALFLRVGATNESESLFPRERADTLMKSVPEIQTRGGEDGGLIASAETYLAIRLNKRGGEGETNVPIRGVQPVSLELLSGLKMVEGSAFEPGTDQVIVGAPLADRIEGCSMGDILDLNGTPFEVVGVFDCEGPSRSEIWGDLDRMTEALQRPGVTRIVARLQPGTDIEELKTRLGENPDTQCELFTEADYLAKQTTALSVLFVFMGIALGLIMGLAAVFTGVNTMLSAISARTQEIGILLALGFRPPRIFLSFLTESVLLGLIGGLVGCVLVLPLNGIQTGTTNWATFTEIAFAFQVTPDVLVVAVLFSLVLGVTAGAVPAWRAARLNAVDAIRR